ncbi:unnamed protein product [Symbiodinium sp. CCMP2592]|nr:unnamed protein product [Symbiodinium sp. CCMP2592]
MALPASLSGSDISLADVLREVSDIMSNPRSWENRRETIFELLRRSVIQSGRNGCLDSKLHGPESSLETAWVFLLTLRRRSPVRQRRIDECLKALSSSDRWMQILKQSSRAQELLRDQAGALPSPLSLEGVGVAETAHEAHPRFGNLSPKAMAGTAVFSAAMQASSGPSSPAGASRAQDRDRNLDREADKIEEGVKQPQQHVTSKVVGATQSAFQAARDTNQKYGVTDKIGEGAKVAYTKARDFEQQHHVTSKVVGATQSAFQAARDTNQKYGVTDKIGEGAKVAYTKARDFEQQHHVTSKVVGATQSAFQAARDTNQKYGVTDKIGEGAKVAYTKARDFEQQHHVTSKVASGLKAGVSGAASAAGSLAKGSNPFTHSATEVEAQGIREGQLPESFPGGAQWQSVPVTPTSDSDDPEGSALTSEASGQCAGWSASPRSAPAMAPGQRWRSRVAQLLHISRYKHDLTGIETVQAEIKKLKERKSELQTLLGLEEEVLPSTDPA